MELAGLLFTCLVLKDSTHSSTQSLIVYFIFQALASMGLLISFFFLSLQPQASGWMLLLFISIKLGVAPFNLQYLIALSRLSCLGLWLGLSFQKLPVVLLLSFFRYAFLPFSLELLLVVGLFLTLLFRSALTFSYSSLVSLLLVSSLFNSSWMILSLLASIEMFLLYFAVYSFLTYWLMFKDSTQSVLWALIGLPPFPLFFVKLLVVYSLVSSYPLWGVLVFAFSLSLMTIFLLSLYFSALQSRLFNVSLSF